MNDGELKQKVCEYVESFYSDDVEIWSERVKRIGLFKGLLLNKINRFFSDKFEDDCVICHEGGKNPLTDVKREDYVVSRDKLDAVLKELVEEGKICVEGEIIKRA